MLRGFSFSPGGETGVCGGRSEGEWSLVYARSESCFSLEVLLVMEPRL